MLVCIAGEGKGMRRCGDQSVAYHILVGSSTNDDWVVQVQTCLSGLPVLLDSTTPQGKVSPKVKAIHGHAAWQVWVWW